MSSASELKQIQNLSALFKPCGLLLPGFISGLRCLTVLFIVVFEAAGEFSMYVSVYVLLFFGLSSSRL